MKTADALAAAADMIEARGWWKPGLMNDAGSRSCCPLLALSEIGEVGRSPAVAFARHIGSQAHTCSDAWDAIVAWNDEQTNGGAVVAALRAAAEHTP